jgi:RNA polymerase sigma factor (sigma-70 family)
MAGSTLSAVFGKLMGSAREATADDELLAQFLDERDERAFAALMERHAGMVLGVCRRVLRNAHDAEDACQAVFLVLARRAPSICKSGSLASWLHGVAWRVAHKLRTSLARRHGRERAAAAPAASGTSAEPDISLREVQRLVDEELNRLPARYKGPLVLCYLEGKTQDEAARELGCTLGSLRGKLERGREMLRARLLRRGVASASALALGALLPSLASAAAPTALVQSTAAASVPMASGAPLPATVPVHVARLASQALQTSLSVKIGIAAMVALCAALVAMAALSFADRSSNAKPVEQSAALEVWSARTRLDVPDSHTWCVAFSPDGKRLAAGSGGPGLDTGKMHVWDADTHKLLFALDTPRSVRCIAFAPDSKTMATAEHDGRARLRNADDGKVLFTLLGHKSQIDTVAFAPDGKAVATTGWDNTVKLWDSGTGLAMNTLEGHNGQVFAVAINRHGTLASGGVDSTARVWDQATGKSRFLLSGHGDVVHCLAFAPPDGKILATASWDKTVKLWNTDTGMLVATLEGHTESVLAVAFSPDGKTLASSAGHRQVEGAPGEIILWNLDTYKARARFLHNDRVYGIAFSADGKTLAAAGWDGSVTLWRQEPGKSDEPNGRDLKFVMAAAQAEGVGPLPPKEYAQSFEPSFKEGVKQIAGLAFYGPEASERVTFEPDGLRVTLPPTYPRPRPGTGVATDFGVKGDFEITVGFEILPAPVAGPPNLGAELRLVVVPAERAEPLVWHKASMNRASIIREIHAQNDGGTFLANVAKWTGDIPKDPWGNENFGKVEQHQNHRTTATVRTGRIRLVRAGTALAFYTSDGGDKEFTLLHKAEFGARDLKNVRILGSTAGPWNSLDVRVTDLRIRADAFVQPEPNNRTPTRPAPEASSDRDWLVPVAVAVPLVLIALVTGGWLVVRLLRPAAPGNPTSPAATPATTIALRCAGCGKGLKAKRDRAGSKVKCPHCGSAVQVPAV